MEAREAREDMDLSQPMELSQAMEVSKDMAHEEPLCLVLLVMVAITTKWPMPNSGWSFGA